MILFQNASLSRQWQSRNLEQQETQLRASRLEIELLKKNIQPHFLLHSLRSITDLLLKEPKTAARLVNALADELRMMLKMTQEKVISLAEEIRLCRSHLEVIGLRGGRRLALEEGFAAGSAEGLAIPPMVLHTLLEQGLEEADENHPEIRFRLEADAGKTLRLRLSHGAPSRARSPFPRDETGLRYVRARLEEAYPGRWSLEAGTPVPGATWQMEIEIRHPERRS
jgi:LytS/YehU family sensor histidine kinase